MTRLAGLYRSPRLVPALLYHALSALSTMLICSNGLQHVRTAYLFLQNAYTEDKRLILLLQYIVFKLIQLTHAFLHSTTEIVFRHILFIFLTQRFKIFCANRNLHDDSNATIFKKIIIRGSKVIIELKVENMYLISILVHIF